VENNNFDYGTFVDIAAAGIGEPTQGWVIGYVPHTRTRIVWTSFERLWFVSEDRIKVAENAPDICPLPPKDEYELAFKDMIVDLKEFCSIHGFTKSNYEAVKEKTIVAFIKSFVVKRVQTNVIETNMSERA
jgi:hypothetical protein